MPLCAEDRHGKMGEGFCGSVTGVLHDLQAASRLINALMMIAVDEHVRAKEGVQEMAGQIVGRVKYVFLWILVQLSVAHLSDCAAEIEVDELHALADAEDGFILLIEQIQCVKLFQSEHHVGSGNMADTAVIVLISCAVRTAGST